MAAEIDRSLDSRGDAEPEARRDWECYERLNCGEGPRGQKVVVAFPYPHFPRDAAEQAAAHFDDHAKFLSTVDPDLWDPEGGAYVIEVVDGGWFHVRIHTTRHYRAEQHQNIEAT